MPREAIAEEETQSEAGALRALPHSLLLSHLSPASSSLPSSSCAQQCPQNTLLPRYTTSPPRIPSPRSSYVSPAAVPSPPRPPARPSSSTIQTPPPWWMRALCVPRVALVLRLLPEKACLPRWRESLCAVPHHCSLQAMRPPCRTHTSLSTPRALPLRVPRPSNHFRPKTCPWTYTPPFLAPPSRPRLLQTRRARAQVPLRPRSLFLVSSLPDLCRPPRHRLCLPARRSPRLTPVVPPPLPKRRSLNAPTHTTRAPGSVLISRLRMHLTLSRTSRVCASVRKAITVSTLAPHSRAHRRVAGIATTSMSL